MIQTQIGRVTRPGNYPLHPDDLYASIMFWRRLFRAVDQAVERWLTRPRIGDTRPHPTAPVFRPRDHFKPDGRPKVKRTLAEAQRFVQAKPEYRFYPCSVCGAYHVGHLAAAA